MIRPIQYLRGFAAMMVVWHHAVGQVDGTLNFIHVPPWGAFGVDLFFGISGFIMLVTTWGKDITPAQFMWHRIRRIVPLYWLATIAMVGITCLAPSLFKTLQWDGPALLKSLAFIPYDSLAAPGRIAPLLVPGWTLNYEMFFYFLFAGSLIFVPQDGLKVVLLALLALVFAGIVAEPTNPVWQVYTNARLLEFGAGMLVGRWYVSRKWKRRDGGNAVLLALGDASYSIYLTHIFTLGVLRELWVKVIPTATMGSSVALMVVSLAACAIAGWLCYELIEKPITKLLSRGRVHGTVKKDCQDHLHNSRIGYAGLRRFQHGSIDAKGSGPMRRIIALLIILAVCVLVTVVVVKVVGDRPDVCEGKPVSCLDGR